MKSIYYGTKHVRGAVTDTFTTVPAQKRSICITTVFLCKLSVLHMKAAELTGGMLGFNKERGNSFQVRKETIGQW